jgi:hypothetical protein
MSTGVVVLIIVVVVVLIALAIRLPRMRQRARLRARERELGQRRDEAAASTGRRQTCRLNRQIWPNAMRESPSRKRPNSASRRGCSGSARSCTSGAWPTTSWWLTTSVTDSPGPRLSRTLEPSQRHQPKTGVVSLTPRTNGLCHAGQRTGNRNKERRWLIECSEQRARPRS